MKLISGSVSEKDGRKPFKYSKASFGSGFSAVSAEINCLSVLNPIKGGKADDKPRFYASTKKMT